MHYPFCFFIYFIFVLSVRAVEPEPVATMEEEAAHIETFTEAINRFQLERFMNPTNGELFNPNEVYSEIERIIDLGIGWYNINALELGDNGQEPILLQLHFGFLWMKFIHQFRMKGKVAFLKNAIRSIYKNDFHLSGVFLFWIGINTQEEKGVFL